MESWSHPLCPVRSVWRIRFYEVPEPRTVAALPPYQFSSDDWGRRHLGGNEFAIRLEYTAIAGHVTLVTERTEQVLETSRSASV